MRRNRITHEELRSMCTDDILKDLVMRTHVIWMSEEGKEQTATHNKLCSKRLQKARSKKFQQCEGGEQGKSYSDRGGRLLAERSGREGRKEENKKKLPLQVLISADRKSTVCNNLPIRHTFNLYLTDFSILFCLVCLCTCGLLLSEI